MLDKELPATDKSESRDWLLFDMGNTEAREWLQEYIGDMIEQNGIDYYRQDFNMEPDKYWARYDEPDRIGMKEIRHIEGLYAFWDYLLERFPGLLIDNCASGGRRLDLETIKRSAPLWRSDYYHYDDPDGYQCHNFGLSFFLPFHGTGILQTDPYSFRSSMSSALICNWKITEPNVSFFDMQARIDEYRRVRDYFLEDYYPLTELEGTTRDDIWLAYQYDRPSDGTGIVVAFRRAACPDPGADCQTVRNRRFAQLLGIQFRYGRERDRSGSRARERLRADASRAARLDAAAIQARRITSFMSKTK